MVVSQFNTSAVADGIPTLGWRPGAVSVSGNHLTRDGEVWTPHGVVCTAIRQTGSRNVLIADGLSFAERLDGAPHLSDRYHRVAYGSHPYFHKAEDQTPEAWEMKFGRFARTAPVVVTEWTTIPRYYADPNTPTAALALLHFLQSRQVGLTTFAFDFAGDKFGSVVYGFPGKSSMYLNGIQPGMPGYGPGSLVQDWYRTGVVPDGLR